MCRNKKMAESALQLFSRLGVKEQFGHLDLPFFSQLSPNGLKSGDVVEFCGTEGTGKSEILLNIAVRCVLPKICDGHKLDKETDIVYVSADSKFDLQRLTSLLEGRISHYIVSSDPRHKELVLSSLARVHVVYCNTSSELTLTLQYLKTFLHHHSNVSALILDNVASYYWMDKDKSETVQCHWITSLKELIQEYHFSVFASKPLLFHKAARQKDTKVEKIAGNDFMPKLWQRMVKYRFYLERSFIGTNHELLASSQFIAHQTSPPGQCFKFIVNENGLLFT